MCSRIKIPPGIPDPFPRPSRLRTPSPFLPNGARTRPSGAGDSIRGYRCSYTPFNSRSAKRRGGIRTTRKYLSTILHWNAIEAHRRLVKEVLQSCADKTSGLHRESCQKSSSFQKQIEMSSMISQPVEFCFRIPTAENDRTLPLFHFCCSNPESIIWLKRKVGLC